MAEAEVTYTGGLRVLVVGSSPLAAQLVSAFPSTAVAAVSPTDLDASWAAALGELGGADLVVCTHYDDAALIERPLTTMSPDVWRHATHGTLDVVRRVTELASGPLHESRGQLAFVLPTIAMTGASGRVALATAAEGVRSWAKSIARQWAASGIAVNCVATALPVVLGDGSADPVPALVGVGFTTGTEPGASDVVAALLALTGPLSGHIAGATVTVDGGVHMEA